MTLGNDNGTDGQTDRQTDRQSATQYAAPPREEGRIIIIIQTFVRRTLSASELNLRRRNKPRKSQKLFGLRFVETITSPWLGFLRGVFLANHLASTDNLARTIKRQNQIPT